MDSFGNQELLYFNGINGFTGEYGLPPMSYEEFGEFIRNERPPQNLGDLKLRRQLIAKENLYTKEGVDPKKLSEAGWGIIFAHDGDPKIKEALTPLLDLRSQQAGQYFKIYDGNDGYRPNETKTRFLARHGGGPGPADPEKVPYYLLIVGTPEAIPYQFQYLLDVQYAVGRISFDTVQEYENYAKSVVAAETNGIRGPERCCFFGTSNQDDRATNFSATHLVQPLYKEFSGNNPTWESESFIGTRATKTKLKELLGGKQAPALLFTATHGMGFPKEHSLQASHQGALLCQNWPGPKKWQQPIPQDFYFSEDDVISDANMLGLIMFCFACYSAGTPLYNDFDRNQNEPIASSPFIAGLPKKILGNTSAALAFVGHIERAWSYSFLWPGVGEHTIVFQDVLKRLIDGHPIGSAMEPINQRYAELATVTDYLNSEDIDDNIGVWTAKNDSRNYIIIGDPAVRVSS
ncbi:MAG: C25 family cysteine peptidase [Chloroflexota bacterium]